MADRMCALLLTSVVGWETIVKKVAEVRRKGMLERVRKKGMLPNLLTALVTDR